MRANEIPKVENTKEQFGPAQTTDPKLSVNDKNGTQLITHCSTMCDKLMSHLPKCFVAHLGEAVFGC